MTNPTNLPGRRKFLKQATVVSIGFVALSRCSSKSSDEKVEYSLELKSDPEGYLDLPEGFSYKVISRAGQKMADGLLVPGRPDGMGAFEGADGKVILVCNHENGPESLEHSPFGESNSLLVQLSQDELYDPGDDNTPGLGGTSTLVYNETSQTLEKQYLSLAGTYRNCAGGVTPWGSWLTCEEDVSTPRTSATVDHGFVFEVPAGEEAKLTPPVPIEAMGRFNHEAVAVDPKTGIVYQTEDRHDGLIYRYIPNTPGKLQEGGKLQAMAIKGKPSFDSRNWEGRSLEVREKLEVTWIDLDDILAPKDDLRIRGFESGAVRFARGEGIWFGDGELFFACTNGGPAKVGQVFRYQPSVVEGTDAENNSPGVLELYAEAEDKSVLHNCDNLTVAPWGDVILCEDNGELNHIRGINAKGEIYNFAVNRSSSSEFAGLVFSPSGKTLFVNLQENGETLAIAGPWDRLSKS